MPKKNAAPPPEAEATTGPAEPTPAAELTPEQEALAHFGLEERHVLRMAVVEKEDGPQVGILTHGGTRLYYPRDRGRVLSDMEKGDGGPVATPAGIFTR